MNESAPRPSHSFEDHTGELRVSVRARSLAELFEEAARALGEVMEESDGGGPEPLDSAEPERVSLSARDREALLVDWLNELIYLSETGRKIYGDAQIERIDDRALSAEIRGRPKKTGRTFVKAATFHGLHIDEGPEGLSATVLLDI
jgi:SHS2 domain-containing protein